VLSFVNIHGDAPLFLGGGLLLPSSILLPFVRNRTGSLLIRLILLNFVAWFLFYRWGDLEVIRDHRELIDVGK
jgi:hypothetical protein